MIIFIAVLCICLSIGLMMNHAKKSIFIASLGIQLILLIACSIVLVNTYLTTVTYSTRIEIMVFQEVYPLLISSLFTFIMFYVSGRKKRNPTVMHQI